MKIDTIGVDVFSANLSVAECQDWMDDPAVDLIDLNSAIDNATSFAAANGVTAYVVIEIKP